MAEAAGLVLGGISLLGLFNNCVDSFGYIQVGKGVGTNFQTCQLKLDAAQTVLSRWGASIGLEDANGAKTLADLRLDPKDVKQAEKFLGQIEFLFDNHKTIADRYKIDTDDEQSLVVHDASKDLKGSGLKLHELMNKMSLNRQGKIKKRDKVRWALYEADQYERFVGDVDKLVDRLVTLFPAAQVTQKKLAENEVAEIKKVDVKALPLAQEAALAKDIAFKDAIDAALKASGLGQTVNNTANFYGDNNSGTQIGQLSGSNITFHGGSKQ